MKTANAFMKRVFLEMIRDPLMYIFALIFPLAMLLLFSIINQSTEVPLIMFEPASLVPGILVFSYSFLMLILSLFVSKDRKSSLLKRLYTSPLKIKDYMIGYLLPTYLLGFIQSILILLFSAFLSLLFHQDGITLKENLFLLLANQPILWIHLFLGFMIGTLLNDKAAPAITSIFISASGILGGAWMPLDTMKGFEKFAFFLPFYPSTYLGRIITKASHNYVDPTSGIAPIYSFSDFPVGGIINIFIYLLLFAFLSSFTFYHQMYQENA